MFHGVPRFRFDGMTGAEATIAQLVEEGTRVVLGIPGDHTLQLCDAILNHSSLRFVTGRHEQDIAWMANGYAHASGSIAVPIVVAGPGVTNSLTALADAYVAGWRRHRTVMSAIPRTMNQTLKPGHPIGSGPHGRRRSRHSFRRGAKTQYVLAKSRNCAKG